MLAAVTELALRRADPARSQPRPPPRAYPEFAAELAEVTGPGHRLPRLRHARRRAGRRRPRRICANCTPSSGSSGLESRVAHRPRVPAPGADARAGRPRRAAGRRRPPGRPAAAGGGPARRPASGRGRLPPRRPGGDCRGDRATGALLRGRHAGRGRSGGAGRRAASADGSRACRTDVLPPVRPVKGQVLRLHVPPAYAPVPVPDGAGRGPRQPRLPGAPGERRTGASAPPARSAAGTPRSPRAGVYELLRDAHELVPGITELPLTETRPGCGRRPPTTRRCSARPTLPGLLLATGHYRNGVLLTPGHRRRDGRGACHRELRPSCPTFTPGASRRRPRFAPAHRSSPYDHPERSVNGP